MRGHDKTDFNVRAIIRAVPIFIVLGALIHVGIWWMFLHYRARQENRDVRQTLIEAPPQVPPEPRLQIDPALEWQTYREAQQKLLNSYTWVSTPQNRARIPIERAMELLVEKERRNERPEIREIRGQ